MVKKIIIQLKRKLVFILIIFCGIANFSAQKPEEILKKIKSEVYEDSDPMQTLSILIDGYGHRLTGSREYLQSAKWMVNQLESYGLQNVKLDRTCDNCRGWTLKGFNVEMIEPNYQSIVSYPLAMSKSSEGIQEGEIIHIKEWWKIEDVKKQFTGKLKGKIVLMGYPKKPIDISKGLIQKYSKEELNEFENRTKSETKSITYTKELMDKVYESDRDDQQFFEFIEKEGALAAFSTNQNPPGVLRVEKTFYFLEDDYTPLPLFSIIPEHFGRLSRMLALGLKPKIKFHLETEFYVEPENNVNILAEIQGTNEKHKSEIVLVGGHFDSWHSSTGATDNGVNNIIISEALRILQKIGYQPKRTIRMVLWHGEEQAFYGSLGYVQKNFGGLWEKPNTYSEKISTYLNLDNGAGLIRGIYLQENKKAEPIFDKAFKPLKEITDGVTTIENQLYTDHVVLDQYNIPSFQMMQDPLAFYSLTLHTNMDVLDYIPEEIVKKNIVIMTWLLYSLAEEESMVPRKNKN